MESGNGETGPPTQTHQAQIKAITKLTVATATLATGGSAHDITIAASVGESAVEHNYLGHRTKQDDVRAAGLSDEEVRIQHKKLLDESGGEGISWLLYSPYEVALDAEHQKRFDSGLKLSTETVVGSAITSLPKGRILGAAMEKLTGKDLGVSQIIEPTPSNFRFNIAGGKGKISTTGSGKNVTAGGEGVQKKASDLAFKQTGLQTGSRADKFVPTKDQPWVVRPGQQYKEKIFGRAQKTGPGHDVRSYREAYKAAQDPSVERVYLNQGINKVLGVKKGQPGYISPNRRPDVTIVKKNGTIHQREVPSGSDDPYALRKRMEDTNSKLPLSRQVEMI